MKKHIAATLNALVTFILVTSTNAFAHDGHDHSTQNTPAVAESRGQSVESGVVNEAPPFETLNSDPSSVETMPGRQGRPSDSDGLTSEPPPATLPQRLNAVPQPRFSTPVPDRNPSIIPRNHFEAEQPGRYDVPSFEFARPQSGTMPHDNCGHDHGSSATPRPLYDRYQAPQAAPQYAPTNSPSGSPYFFGEDPVTNDTASGDQCPYGHSRRASSSCPLGNDRVGFIPDYVPNSPTRHLIMRQQRQHFATPTYDIEPVRQPHREFDVRGTQHYDSRTPYRDRMPLSDVHRYRH